MFFWKKRRKGTSFYQRKTTFDGYLQVFCRTLVYFCSAEASLALFLRFYSSAVLYRAIYSFTPQAYGLKTLIISNNEFKR